MLKAGNLASWEDHRVRGVKSGRIRADRGISHVCVDNTILFLQKCLLNSCTHFIRLLSELLILIGCWSKIKS